MGMKEHNKLEIYAHPNCLKIMSDRVNQYENADLISEDHRTNKNIKRNKLYW